MQINSNSRFVIDKNAYEHLTKQKDLESVILNKKEICDFSGFFINYLGDSDFSAYNKVNFKKIHEIHKYYPNIELFLQNINFDEIYKSIETSAFQILEKITKNIEGNEKSLAIISLTALEMSVLGNIFKELGINNIVYNFNKQILLNSVSKSFEAILYLVAYEKSPYFKNKTLEIANKIKEKNLNLEFIKQNSYIICDENDYYPNYEYLQIDNYLKNQIGFSLPKNIYRVDEYPEIDFLLKKEIEKIIFIDNDYNICKSFDYYSTKIEKEQKQIKFRYEKYDLIYANKVGIYEDYLVEKDKEYRIYKKNIEVKALKTAKKLENSYKFEADYPTTGKEKKISETKKVLIPLLVFYPILFLAFIINDLGKPSTTTSSSGSTNSSSSYIGGIGNLGSSSSSVSSSSSTSIIKSFGGGGFSKGSSS